MALHELTLGDIKRRVRSVFGDEAGALLSDDDIKDWANDAQLDLARKTLCLQSHRQTSVVAGDGSYGLPEDFLGARRVTFDGKILEPTTLDELDLVHPHRDAETGTDTPTRYYIWGGKLYVHPNPTNAGVGNLDMFYGRMPLRLENDGDQSEIPAQYRPDLERFILAKAKEKDEEFDQASVLRADYELQVANARSEQNQPEDSYPAVRLLPGDDW